MHTRRSSTRDEGSAAFFCFFLLCVDGFIAGKEDDHDSRIASMKRAGQPCDPSRPWGGAGRGLALWAVQLEPWLEGLIWESTSCVTDRPPSAPTLQHSTPKLRHDTIPGGQSSGTHKGSTALVARPPPRTGCRAAAGGARAASSKQAFHAPNPIRFDRDPGIRSRTQQPWSPPCLSRRRATGGIRRY